MRFQRTHNQFYSDLDKRLLGVFLIFGKWPLKFWEVIWPKDSLVLGWSGQKTHWCWLSPGTKESFGQITPTPRSLLARSPPKTLKAIFRKSKKHQGVFCPFHCRDIKSILDSTRYAWSWYISVQSAMHFEDCFNAWFLCGYPIVFISFAWLCVTLPAIAYLVQSKNTFFTT